MEVLSCLAACGAAGHLSERPQHAANAVKVCLDRKTHTGFTSQSPDISITEVKLGDLKAA